MICYVYPGSGFFSTPGSLIQGSKKPRIRIRKDAEKGSMGYFVYKFSWTLHFATLCPPLVFISTVCCCGKLIYVSLS
jgi:hypothetical protein